MKKHILVTGLVVAGLGLILGGVLYIKNLRNEVLGLGVVTDFSTTLASSITSSATSLTLSSVADRAGNTITFTSSTFGDAVFFNIEPGTSRSEIVRCTGLSGSQFTGCTRGLPFGANGCNNTASTTLQQAHNSGARVVMSNVCQIYSELVAKDIPQTMRSLLTIQSGGIVLGDGSATTTNQDILWNADTDFIIRGNRSLGVLEYSEDSGVSFSRFGSTSSIADAGRGLLRLSGTGATTTIFHVATGTRSGLGFYDFLGNAVGSALMQIKVSSTQGLWIDESVGGLLAVTSTWFVGGNPQTIGLLGFASTSFIIDADNAGGTGQTTGITFETGTGNGSVDKFLFVDSSDGYTLKFGDRDGTDITSLVSGSGSSTVPRSFAGGQTTLATALAAARNLTVTHNLGTIPAKIKLLAFPTPSSLNNASSSFSEGVWISGVGYSRTPGANSSTFVSFIGPERAGFTCDATNGAVDRGATSASTTVRLLLCRSGTNDGYEFIDGVVFDVTSSTFGINFRAAGNDTSNGGLGIINIQWEAEF